MTTAKIVKEGWVVITPTLLQGNRLAWSTEDENGEAIPDVFDSEVEAYKAIAEDYIIQLQDFIDGNSSFYTVDRSGPEEFVARYREYEDGRIEVYEELHGDKGLTVPILETTLSKWRDEL